MDLRGLRDYRISKFIFQSGQFEASLHMPRRKLAITHSEYHPRLTVKPMVMVPQNSQKLNIYGHTHPKIYLSHYMQVFPYPFFLQFKIIDMLQNTLKRNILLHAYIPISKKNICFGLVFYHFGAATAKMFQVWARTTKFSQIFEYSTCKFWKIRWLREIVDWHVSHWFCSLWGLMLCSAPT